uniref:DUF86 domain-containing protein n=1 Tax=Heterorhabditis bacteriophora TaxID=37862 RepID=A0A1I7XPY9_HETBA
MSTLRLIDSINSINDIFGSFNRPYERTPEELELVYEELLHVKALSHLSTMVKRELATVIGFEHHINAGRHS